MYLCNTFSLLQAKKKHGRNRQDTFQSNAQRVSQSRLKKLSEAAPSAQPMERAHRHQPHVRPTLHLAVHRGTPPFGRLRRLSYKTGFQIPPNTCGKGLTIWHWGAIVINPKTHIGENCTLYPGVLIGHKTPEEGKSATIGNNVFIAAGTKIIGDVTIGDNVTIGVNTVIVKDVPSNVVIAGNPYKIIRRLDDKDNR